ncbi:MAG: hypothetical protein HEP71_30620 [Roseivirga sp.]|nr:hypothetical protein [Roseivirga sp.]
MKTRSLLTILGLLSCVMVMATGKEDLKVGFVTGNPEINSIKAIAFGPENILFVGDNSGMSLYAIDVKDQPGISREALNLERIDQRLAAAMGAKADEISIQDMAVNPLSKNVFFAVSRERGEETHYALFRLSDKGLKEFSLEEVSHSKMKLKDAPTASHQTWNRPSRTYTVTDLHYANGELIVSGLSNEEFSSGLRRVPFPFNEEMTTTNVQVYHVTHGRNETHAPIYRFLPVQLEGQWHVVAGYMCTPLVTFKLDELNGNNKLIGKTVAEIGAGNTPTGIISYQYEGQDYVLVGNNVHPLTKITGKDLFRAKALTAPMKERGVKRENVKLGSISHIADYDEEHFLILVRDKAKEVSQLKLVAKADI